MLISDPHRIKQILIILIGNSLKFTFKGKTELKIENHSNNLLKFTITDTGIGFSEDLKSNLNKLFHNVSNESLNQHGIGLGLTLTKYIINKLGPEQDIIIDSKENQGSSISFSIFSQQFSFKFNFIIVIYASHVNYNQELDLSELGKNENNSEKDKEKDKLSHLYLTPIINPSSFSRKKKINIESSIFFNNPIFINHNKNEEEIDESENFIDKKKEIKGMNFIAKHELDKKSVKEINK